MENLTGGTPPVRYLPCVVPCKLYFVSYKIVKILSNAVLIRDFSPCFLKIMNYPNDEKNRNNNYKHTIFLLFYNFHSASPKLFRIRS